MQRGVCRCACGAGGVITPRAAELNARLLDLEKGRGQGYAVAPMMTSPADAMTKATRDAMLDAQDVEIGKAASEAIKCILRKQAASCSSAIGIKDLQVDKNTKSSCGLQGIDEMKKRITTTIRMMLRPEEYQRRDPRILEKFLKIHQEIEDKQAHERLRDDLVEHRWAIHGSS